MKNEKIYASENSDVQIGWSDAGVHGGDRQPTQTTGWRERSGKKKREQVTFRDGAWVKVQNPRTRKRKGFDARATAKPFPGHLEIWYQEEERRNPGWQDFVPGRTR